MFQNNGSASRQTLMRRVQMYQFAVLEAALFLDSYPDNQEALQYHNKYDQLLQEAKAEYVKRFGALEHSASQNEMRWNWVDDPWPWDLAANSDTAQKEE